MTLAQIQSNYFRRTHTEGNSFPAADQVIALNNANEYALSLIQDKTDNFIPTAWTTSDLTTGTATPVFDSRFHEIIPLHVAWERSIEDDKLAYISAGIERQMLRVAQQMEKFYGARQYRIFTVTIATPGLFTRPTHGLRFGERIIFSTSGALPTGLSANVWYYVVWTGTDSSGNDAFQVSATFQGTPINTTGSQSGTHWFGIAGGQRATMAVIRFR
jgi:hypothetical protein